ncbi:MAG: hypothetical protein ABI210_11840, partial [Abditibacteriaceae bacterium]
MGMVTGLSYKKSEIGYPLPPYGPKSTFICADTNKDGVIDQVTLNVLLQEVDAAGAEPTGQDITMPQVVNLPNVRSIANVR